MRLAHLAPARLLVVRDTGQLGTAEVQVGLLGSLRDQLDVDPVPVPKSTRMPASHRVEINPRVMMGKPVIRGTRITVELILRKLSEGATEGDLLDAYPRLTRADIRAAVTFAADTIAHQETLTVEPIRKRARR